MKKLAVVLVCLVVLAASALPAQAYHWHYYHPLWGLGLWPHLAGPFYPPVAYVTTPPVVIQPPQLQQPQVYIQRQPEPPPQPIVWYWCSDPQGQGFHPYIRECKGNAWMKVVPETAPPQQR